MMGNSAGNIATVDSLSLSLSLSPMNNGLFHSSFTAAAGPSLSINSAGNQEEGGGGGGKREMDEQRDMIFLLL